MKLSKSEIRREIEKISSSYSTGEIFSSPYLNEILQAIVTSACESLNRIPQVESICDPSSDFTACTEGTRVMINTLGPLIRERDTNWDKYTNVVGHVIHECGHVLFTDFIEQMNMFYAWLDEDSFSFYPENPDVKGINTTEIIDYMNSHPNYRNIFINEMKGIQNCMEDVYIENRLYEQFDGVATLGLAKSREELYRIAPTEKEIYDRVLEGQITPLIAFSQVLLTRRTGYPDKVGGPLNEEEKEVQDLIYSALDQCNQEIDRLKWEEKGIDRCRMLNRIFVKVRPLLPEPPDNQDLQNPQQALQEMLEQIQKELENQQNASEEGEGGSQQQQGGSQSSAGNDYSSEQAESQTEKSKQMSQQAGASTVPQGCTRPVKAGEPDKTASENSKQQSNAQAQSSEACQRKFEQAVKDVAKKEFEAKDEKQHSKELKKEAGEIEKALNEGNRGSSSFSGKLNIDRAVAEDYEVSTYNSIFSEVSTTSKHLAKKLSNILQEKRETESVDSGYLMGQRFNARDVVHGDGKYFSRISEPDGKLRVCFGVLVDESGSMGWSDHGASKAEKARKATILLEDTLRKLDVPFMIVGHTTKGYGVALKSYVDFDTNDGKDCYRLAGITGHNNNIDGAAISYVGEKLLKRPEEVKVMIVISDGRPCGGSYYSENADTDTTLAIKHYRKKGVNVFGAIVDSFSSVSTLYGEEFCFDCSEGRELERQLCRLVKRYLVK